MFMLEKVQYGVVTENTKVIFRSESAKFFIFFQMSREMWEFDEDGDLFYEKALQGFLPELFSNWSLIGVNHLVSIVLFTRVYFEDLSADDVGSHPSICIDHRFLAFFTVSAAHGFTLFLPLISSSLNQRKILPGFLQGCH
jgi:hypothetical protein